MMLEIYPYGNKEGPFSGPGDSGSIIADGNGRIIGLLTGGAGKTGSTNPDVTYATPFYWLLALVGKLTYDVNKTLTFLITEGNDFFQFLLQQN